MTLSEYNTILKKLYTLITRFGADGLGTHLFTRTKATPPAEGEPGQAPKSRWRFLSYLNPLNLIPNPFKVLDKLAVWLSFQTVQSGVEHAIKEHTEIPQKFDALLRSFLKTIDIEITPDPEVTPLTEPSSFAQFGSSLKEGITYIGKPIYDPVGTLRDVFTTPTPPPIPDAQPQTYWDVAQDGWENYAKPFGESAIKLADAPGDLIDYLAADKNLNYYAAMGLTLFGIGVSWFLLRSGGESISNKVSNFISNKLSNYVRQEQNVNQQQHASAAAQGGHANNQTIVKLGGGPDQQQIKDMQEANKIAVKEGVREGMQAFADKFMQAKERRPLLLSGGPSNRHQTAPLQHMDEEARMGVSARRRQFQVVN